MTTNKPQANLIGWRVRLVKMAGDDAPLPVGLEGRVFWFRDVGEFVQIGVNWDNGSKLALAVPPDEFEVVGK